MFNLYLIKCHYFFRDHALARILLSRRRVVLKKKQSNGKPEITEAPNQRPKPTSAHDCNYMITIWRLKVRPADHPGRRRASSAARCL
jgi:hypothetical protein